MSLRPTLFVAAILAAGPTPGIAQNPIRVMPLGDSITEARHGDATYRYFLWNELRNHGLDVEFVGSMVGTQGPGGIGHNGIPKYPNFDQDHEGHWGWRADQIAGNIRAWAIAAQPDVVLCHIGTNDLFQRQSVSSTIADIGSIIDELRVARPNIKIFLAQVISVGSAFSVDVGPLNAAIPGLIANKHTAQSPVIRVDHFTGWNSQTHTYDGVHANQAGEIRLSDKWTTAMMQVFSGSLTPAFSATPTQGQVPLQVGFSENSLGGPTSWLWTFGDGGTSSDQNPSHLYSSVGTYSVTLRVTNAAGTRELTKSNYISVAVASNEIRVMPFGDSITASSNGFASYRYFLWHELENNGYCVDFVGSQSGVRKGQPKYTDFDQNYEGGWGLRADQLAAGAYAWASAAQPHVVLVHAGIDDVYRNQSVSSTIADLGFLIDELRRAKPDVVILMAQLNPFGAPFAFDVGPLNAAIPGLVAGKTSAQSPVLTVDHFSGWNTAVHTHNGIHSNETGERRMADTWYAVLAQAIATCFGGGPTTPAADFTGTPTTGEAPRQVTFEDRSTNAPTSWAWEFGDGSTSNSANPSHSYSAAGTYTVKLTVSNSAGSDTMIRTDYIRVTEPSGGGGSQPGLKVMLLGDSITASSKGFASYRYFLWHQLIASGHCVDFVGSRRGVRSGNPKYSDFDQDYEGGWGLRADQLADQAFQWGSAAMPDVVLVHAGIDDIYQSQSTSSTIADLGRLIDELRRANPAVVIYLAQINPFGPRFGFDVVPLNNAMPALVANKTSARSPVILVDHFAGWDTTAHTHNGIHSNETGEQRMANTWHAAMVAQGTRKCGGGGSKPATISIMPLGDSITASSNGWASYRYFLWHQLINSGHCPEFVGTQNGVRTGNPKFSDFDQDYEGGWGLRADQLADQAFAWATANPPDVVLVHAGIDDIYQNQSTSSTIADLGRLIDELRRAKPDVKILLAQLNPFGPRFPFDVVPLNNAIPGLASSKSTTQSPVIVVDHFSGWNTAIHTHNEIHSNETGEQRMANTWHDAILQLSLTCTGNLVNTGGGCGGPSSAPSLRARPGTVPTAGDLIVLTLGGLPPGAPAVGVLGFGDQNFDGATLPRELSALGMPNCWLRVRPDILTPLTGDQSRSATWTLVLPDSLESSGGRFHVQAFVRDPGANAQGFIATNAKAGVVRR